MRVVHCEEMLAAIESVHRAVRDSWIRRDLQRVAQLELALSRDEGREGRYIPRRQWMSAVAECCRKQESAPHQDGGALQDGGRTCARQVLGWKATVLNCADVSSRRSRHTACC